MVEGEEAVNPTEVVQEVSLESWVVGSSQVVRMTILQEEHRNLVVLVVVAWVGILLRVHRMVVDQRKMEN